MLQTRIVNNNISLTYIPMGKLKTTTIGFYIHCPLDKKTASYNALLAAILKQGSCEYPTRELLTKRLDELYGSTLAAGVSKKGEDHILSFEAECISDKYTLGNEKLLSQLVSVLFGVIFSPAVENGKFNDDVFKQEQKNLIDRIRASVNDKRAYANERICQITSEGTPYEISRLGDEETVSKIDNNELYDYYTGMITSSKIDIYVAGETELDFVYDKLTSLVSMMDFVDGEIPSCEILAGVGDVKTITEHMDVTQGKLAMSFTTGIKPSDDANWGMIVANSIFGGGAHSKLFNNVREKLSLAYYAGSQMHKFKGFIAVNAGVEFENFEKAYDEILVQLDELKNGKISDEEFTAAKMSLINSLNSYYDDQLYMQSFYLGEKIAGTNYSIDDYIKNIENVSIKDVIDASQNITLNSVYYLAGRE
ncbi:MAG: insulinase family protein [Eubacteriales bacterium]|nr:insulinase family protein [Eubacteriales bacterium]